MQHPQNGGRRRGPRREPCIPVRSLLQETHLRGGMVGSGVLRVRLETVRDLAGSRTVGGVAVTSGGRS